MGKRLNQIVAIERDVKTRAYKDLTADHHLLQKPAIVEGMSRTYKPRDDDGERFPAESKHVAMRVRDALADVRDRQRELWDITLTKDTGNMNTKADITADDGTVILRDVPVPTLLFLEKQFQDLHTFVEKLPVLDPAERWTLDTQQGFYTTDPVETVKTKKIKKAIVLYPASVEHPAQAQLIDDDVIVGTWTAIKQSGAIKPDERRKLLDRVERMSKAVKEARERANHVEVDERKMADTIFDIVLGGALG